MKIPEGFRENPYVYPSMSCPLCGYRFRFNQPFHEYNRVLCQNCKKESDIPDSIIEQFLDNISFQKYISDRRTPPPSSRPQTPPPIFK